MSKTVILVVAQTPKVYSYDNLTVELGDIGHRRKDHLILWSFNGKSRYYD